MSNVLIDVAALNLLPLVKVGLVVKLFNDEKAKGSFQMKENMILLNSGRKQTVG